MNTFMEEKWMNNEETLAKLKEFQKELLKMERESLSNINKTDDKTMVTKIIHLYEDKFDANK